MTSPEIMLTFYRRLYPFKPIFNWINQEHGPTRLFTHREFSFTLAGDVYLRYHSFSNAEELKKSVCQLVPTRFEIGPVYSARPRDKKTVRPGAFNPVQRELVFDIDMTDYDPVRTCCSEANICRRCWAFIAAAVRVIDDAIRNQFGFKCLLWVYSGRRGIHLWISDKEAMELTDDERKAIVGWLTVVQGSKESKKRVNVRPWSKPLPPSLEDALKHLGTVFTHLILDDQQCFNGIAGTNTLLGLIPDSGICEALRRKWTAKTTSSEKWDDFKTEINKCGNKPSHVAIMQDIVLEYTYPRLDAEVSKHRNHLLKAPFCIHPKTGRVCVPVDASRIDEFDPESVPTVSQLLDELNDHAAKVRAQQAAGEVVAQHADWEHTSLKPYVEMLEKHTRLIMNEVRERKMDMSW